ncbi:MAG: hypothetical protein JW889_02975 [Verrucomicrobia bacterium]|nr:hypothetical protein [Verrucomicrobiota bacterium]
MPQRDIDSLLQRRDKWYLGGGDAVIWAPRFPMWLTRPGFWDEAHVYNEPFGPVFAVSLIDEEVRAVPLRARRYQWRPSSFSVNYVVVGRAARGLRVRERKCVLDNDVLASDFILRNEGRSPRRLHVVLWTCHPYAPDPLAHHVRDVRVSDEAIEFVKMLQVGPGPKRDVTCVLGTDAPRTSYLVQLSQPTENHPRWALTPFHDRFDGHSLGDEINLGGVHRDGLVYVGQHAVVELAPGEKRAIKLCAAVAESPDRARAALKNAIATPGLLADRSRRAWGRYFASLPQFECDDEYLTRYYWYRWYGLRLLTTHGNNDITPWPSLNEGIEYFRGPIAYSAPGHMLETRWMADPELARGCLRNFIHNQRRDGSFRGTLRVHLGVGWDFFHTNWGRAVMAVDELHPDDEFLREVYGPLCRYAEYFEQRRDSEGSDLYDVIDQFETGQEYMSRYTAVNAAADTGLGEPMIRLKGVDATLYVYELQRALARIARRLGLNDDAVRWDADADATRAAMRSRMWDPEREMFSDIDPSTNRRTGIEAAVCFYPYFTDVAEPKHVAGLERHLLDPDEFWTPFPVATTSRKDPSFDPASRWRRKRHHCPWNGRVWPMVNSHIVDALAGAGRHDPRLRERAAELLRKFVRMMFFYQDVSRPNCFEHYNPLTGAASVFRGIDDYQHSWVVDLIIRYVAGFRPQPDGTYAIEPLPFGLKRVVLDNLHYRGKRLSIAVVDGRVSVKESRIRAKPRP